MTKSLGQAYSIQTFDQQLYAIAKQFEWAKQNTFKTHFLRLGSFHTMSCFVASNLKITQRISETFSICPAHFEIISKALGKRFGIPRTFGFENGRHDVCEEASLVI
jgi:hypothetical protein